LDNGGGDIHRSAMRAISLC